MMMNFIFCMYCLGLVLHERFASDSRASCWRYANSPLTDRQQQLDFVYGLTEVQPPRSLPAARSRSSTPPTRCSPSAPTTRSRSRTSRAPPASPAGWFTTSSAAARRSLSACSSASAPGARKTSAPRGPQRPCARGGHRVALAGLDRGQPHGLAGHDRPRRGHRRPRRETRGRRPRGSRRRAARGLSRRHRRRLTAAALRTRMLDRPQPRRHASLAPGEATREATHELLASTLEHVLRTFGAPPASSRRTATR